MSKKIFITFPLHTILFLLFYSRLIQSAKYCSDERCKEHHRNRSCSIQPGIPARHCVDYEKTIKTERDKQAILNKINSRRNKVASGEIRSFPPAGNMMKLEWSENLEIAAQRWADQCVGQGAPDVKDECLNLETEGQNIATIYGDAPGLSPLVLVDVWYMELLHMNASIMSQYIPSSEAGLSHYDYFTQLAWAESSYVGCGSVKFKEPKKDDKGINRIVNRLVCNFSPVGNRWQKPVYLRGEPCSACPEGSGCDVEYNALCKSIRMKAIHTTEDATNMIENINTNTTVHNDSTFIHSDQIVNDTNDDEYFMPYNYFTNFDKGSIEAVTASPTIGKQCKDMAVDDFLELLKKKLSSDPMFKDLASKSNSQGADVTNTDPNVAAFVSKLYSKKVPSTTTKITENEFINSTLLVDLVEAVIFRSGDKIPPSVETESYFNTPIVEVNPIKIKAELSEIKMNQDFTGHYFFPEDDDNEATKTDITEAAELYDDMSSFSMSDVVLEIEDFKRIKTTRDFLEEILESESASENHVMRHKRQNMNGNENLKYIEKTNHLETRFENTRRCMPNPCKPRKFKIKYSDLLQQIALDLKVLKLSDRFHCTKTKSSANNVNTLFPKILLIVMFPYVLK